MNYNGRQTLTQTREQGVNKSREWTLELAVSFQPGARYITKSTLLSTEPKFR